MDLKNLKTIVRHILFPFFIVVLLFFVCDRFDTFFPYFALFPLLGLIAGPYGALAATLSITILNICYGLPYDVMVFDGIGTFICSYFTYRLWYAFNGKNKVIRLDSSVNLLKLMGVIFASSMLFAYGCLINYSMFDYYNVIILNNNLNFLALSIFNYFNLGVLFLMISLLLFSYFNLLFYYPGKVNNVLDSFNDYIKNIKFIKYIDDLKFFNYIFYLWVVVSFILLMVYLINGEVKNYFIISIIMYIIGIIIMFKPTKKYDLETSKNQSYNLLNSSENYKSFSLNEIFMVLFIVFILGMIVFLLML